MALVLLGVVVLNFYLFAVVPKGFFPQQSMGALIGFVNADESISFQAMRGKMLAVESILQHDPAVEHVVAFTGGGATNEGFLFSQLKPLAVRRLSDDAVIARLRPKLEQVTGAQAFLQSAQMIRFGGRQGNAQYQYTLLSDDLSTLDTWTPKITAALKKNPALRDVSSDREQGGLEVRLHIDRPTVARLGVDMTEVDNTLYDAFGQRQVSTIYQDMNQYHVVMEVAPSFWQSPQTLDSVYVSTSGGALSGTESTAAATGAFGAIPAPRPPDPPPRPSSVRSQNYRLNQLVNSAGSASTGAAVSTAQETMVPLSALSYYGPGLTPLDVNHQGPFVAATFSFNLPPGEPLGTATAAIHRTMESLHVPISIQGEFAGTAKAFQQTALQEPLLLLASILTVYIVLGILYESLVQPITILSTLPSSGIGAVIALLICGEQFTLIALIAVILLIGIVLKNAIMMVDVALDDAARARGERGGGDPCRLHAALPPHHHDDGGGDARRIATCRHDGAGLGDAASARHCDRWRPLHQPDPDALHHPRGVHISRSPAFVVPESRDTPASQGSPARNAGRTPSNRDSAAKLRPGGRAVCFTDDVQAKRGLTNVDDGEDAGAVRRAAAGLHPPPGPIPGSADARVRSPCHFRAALAAGGAGVAAFPARGLSHPRGGRFLGHRSAQRSGRDRGVLQYLPPSRRPALPRKVRPHQPSPGVPLPSMGLRSAGKPGAGAAHAPGIRALRHPASLRCGWRPWPG